MMGNPLLSFLLILLLIPALAGCVSESRDEIPLIRLQEGFYWDYGKLKIWHAGNGSVLTEAGDQQQAEFIGLQVPGWMRWPNKWDDSRDENEYFEDPEESLQIQLAVTPDLKEVIAYRSVCSSWLAEDLEGPWRCSDAKRHHMFWYRAGDPWFFGVSDFLHSWNNPSDPDHVLDGWRQTQETSQIRMEAGHSRVSTPDWFSWPEEFLRFFESGVLYFDDPSVPPTRIEVVRSDDQIHTFELQNVSALPQEHLVQGASNPVLAPDMPRLHERQDYLPFEAREDSGYSDFPWSEFWDQIEDFVDRPDRTVVLHAGFNYTVTLTVGEIVVFHQTRVTVILLEQGDEPRGYYITRTENAPQAQQVAPASGKVLISYDVEAIEHEWPQRLSRFDLPQKRVAMDEAAVLAEWLLNGSIGHFEIATRIENESASQLVYTFAGWGIGATIDAGQGTLLRAHSYPEAVDRFWSPGKPPVPYRFNG